MKPLRVRELSDPERQTLQAGLRSSDGFTVRRCHILLASARGDTAPVIAQAIGCSPQAVRNVLRAFETRGLAVVTMCHSPIDKSLFLPVRNVTSALSNTSCLSSFKNWLEAARLSRSGGLSRAAAGPPAQPTLNRLGP